MKCVQTRLKWSGSAWRSISATRAPCRASRAADVQPAMLAPTTQASYESSAATASKCRMGPPQASTAAVADAVGHPRLERPELDEAGARVLGEESAGLAEAGELGVV